MKNLVTKIASFFTSEEADLNFKTEANQIRQAYGQSLGQSTRQRVTASRVISSAPKMKSLR